MSKSNKQYFYFRFTNTFFLDEKIRNMKHVPLYGHHFIVIYLELCTLSLSNKGYLRVEITSAEMSYTSILAKDIGEDAEMVSMAMSYYIKHGFVKKIEREYYIELEMEIVVNNTGTSSLLADRKREYRKRLSDNIEGTLALIENNDEYKVYGAFKNVMLKDNEYRYLEEKEEKLVRLINKYSIYKNNENLQVNNDFEEILEFMSKN